MAIKKINGTYQQAKIFMQFGIDARLNNDLAISEELIAHAKKLFEEVGNRTDIAVATGWLEGIRERRRLTLP